MPSPARTALVRSAPTFEPACGSVVHGAHPLAGHELGQIGRLQLRRGVFGDQFGRGHGEQRAEPEGHRRPAPDFDQRRIEGVRQPLPAPFGGRRQPVPSGRCPIPIGLFPARRHGHGAVLERRTVGVADPIEGRDHAVGEFAGLLGDRRDQIVAEVAEQAIAARRLKPCNMIEREKNIGDRGGVRHEPSLGKTGGPHGGPGGWRGGFHLYTLRAGISPPPRVCGVTGPAPSVCGAAAGFRFEHG